MNVHSSTIQNYKMEDRTQMSIKGQVDQQMWSIHTMERYSAIKEMKCWYSLETGWTSKHWVKWKKPDAKGHVSSVALWGELLTGEHVVGGGHPGQGWSQCWGEVITLRKGHTRRGKCTKMSLRSRAVFVFRKFKSSILWLYTIYPDVRTASCNRSPKSSLIFVYSLLMFETFFLKN